MSAWIFFEGYIVILFLRHIKIVRNINENNDPCNIFSRVTEPKDYRTQKQNFSVEMK